MLGSLKNVAHRKRIFFLCNNKRREEDVRGNLIHTYNPVGLCPGGHCRGHLGPSSNPQPPLPPPPLFLTPKCPPNFSNSCLPIGAPHLLLEQPCMGSWLCLTQVCSQPPSSVAVCLSLPRMMALQVFEGTEHVFVNLFLSLLLDPMW